MPTASALRCLFRQSLFGVALLVMATAATAQVNNPPLAPLSILVFPERSFVSASGYNADDLVVVKVIHPSGTIVSTDPSSPLVPEAALGALPTDPFAGNVEVNHPGGHCWFNATPDIRPGDIVQIDIVGGPRAGRSDATTVANVRLTRPVQTGDGRVEVHGTAQDAFGNPLPLASLEQRLLSGSQDLFDRNGRRVLRAGAAGGLDGSLGYDTPGSLQWTAIYTGLSQADVDRALGADTRILWLGNGTLVEGTIFENGAAVRKVAIAPCVGPLEIIPPPPGSELVPPSTPTNLSAAVSSFNRVDLAWNASTDNVGVTSYGVYRDGVAIANVQNTTGTAPAPTAYVDHNVPEGSHLYTVDAADEVGNRSDVSVFATATTVHQPDLNMPVNDPPLLPTTLIAFPSRDFVSNLGFLPDDRVDVLVIRAGRIVSSALGVVPVGDVVEVNHPGGACWGGITPELRAGDILRTIAYRPDGSIRTADQTHVAGVAVLRPIKIRDDDPRTPGFEGSFQVNGTAMDPNGKPLPLGQIQQRIVAPGDRFDVNGKRTLRTGIDGTLAYDTANNPLGINWTATYVGLNGDDLARAVGGTSTTTGRVFSGGESRILWLGQNPALLNETTIYENTDVNVPGPAALACTSPLEPIDSRPPTPPANFQVVPSGLNGMLLTWQASTDDWGVAHYRVLRDGQPLANVGASTLSYVDPNPPAGSHAYSVVALDNASARGPGGGTGAQQIIAGFGNPYGNVSQPADPVTIVQPDRFPPTTPGRLTIATGNGKATSFWTPSTDNVGVVSYGVYRDGSLIATVPSPTTTYKDSGLVTGTYSYSVDAADAAGLRSPRTASVASRVVFVPDTTPPTIPGAVTAVVSPDMHARHAIVSWNAATDSMGVMGYTLYRDGVARAVLGPLTLSFGDSSLATATYVYQVDAFDAANNHSAHSDGATVVIANDPPLSGHQLIAHPARDWVSATGYPDTQGPYGFAVLRGGRTFFSTLTLPDSSGTVQVNRGPTGACWIGATPDLKAGDVVRITDANGIAEQTTVVDLTTQFAVPAGPTTVTVHGTAQGPDGAPLALSELEHQLVVPAGTFAASGASMLRANASGISDGSLAYDAPGSTHWTAQYTGLSAADVALVTGRTTDAAAESRALWLGRDPFTGTERTVFETGPGVTGGPNAPLCVAPAESPAASAALFPARLEFGDVGAIPPASSRSQSMEVLNNGSAPLQVFAVYAAGLHAAEFAVTISRSLPITLAPGDHLTVDVTFSPFALGARQAALRVSSDAPNSAALGIPLAGNGITDTTPPTVPTRITAAVSPDVHGHDAVITWDAASDSVGVTGYTVYRDGTAIATTTPGTLTYEELALGAGPHRYQVDAFDLQGNHSAPSGAAAMVIASEPPIAGHLLIAHPSRDWVSATGYPADMGPYVFTVFRHGKVFSSGPENSDGSGLVQVNHAGGGCWSGVTPDLKAGDVVRITNAAGFADQTVVADVMSGFPIATDSATVIVHGSAQDDAGDPLPLDQLEHRLVAAAGVFDVNGTATLHATPAAGAEGTLAYDAPGSTKWTATYSGLSAADVARATGGTDLAAGTLAASESQAIWLGRSPLAGTEQMSWETGPGVTGGPLPQCTAPTESEGAIATTVPAVIQFDRQGVSPSSTTQPRAILFRNTGNVPMRLRGVHVSGLHAVDFSIVSSDAPSVLDPGSFCTVMVAFTPSALGLRQAAVSFMCDAVNGAALSTPLLGTGWSGLVIASPGYPMAEIGVGTPLNPLVAIPAQGTIPVTIHWDPSPTPQTDHYDLQQSINGGPFVATAVQPGPATAVTLDLPLTSIGKPAAYRYRVRAAGVGETGDWLVGAALAMEPVDDSNGSRVGFTGSWSPIAVSGAWGGGMRSTSGRCRVELRADATFGSGGSIAWVTSKGPDRGLVFVFVDDQDSVGVDLYSPTPEVGVVGYVARNLTAGKSHRMLVRTRGLKNPLATGTRVDTDAFIVVNVPARSAVVETKRGPDALLSQIPEPPAALVFSPVVPNPVVDHATLAFGLPRDGVVRLDVLDLQGRLVQQLANGVFSGGEHRIIWNGHTGAAQAAHPGVYFAVLRFSEQTLVRRIVWTP